MPIHWKLKDYLAARNLSTYRLIKASGLAQGTAYRLVNGDTHNLNADTLDAVVEALRALTSEQVEIQDVLEYRPRAALTSAPVPVPETETTPVPAQGLAQPPRKERTQKPFEIPPEVEVLRRRHKRGEFKNRGFRTLDGLPYHPEFFHTEMGYRFAMLRQPRGRKEALAWLRDVAARIDEPIEIETAET